MAKEIENDEFKITRAKYTRFVNNQAPLATYNMVILEYNIAEAFTKNNCIYFDYPEDADHLRHYEFYPKRIFSRLLHHMTVIVCHDHSLFKTLWYFCLCGKPKFRSDYKVIEKDIEVEADFNLPTYTFETIMDSIANGIHNMDDQKLTLYVDDYDNIYLMAVKIEFTPHVEKIRGPQNKNINGENTFKEETCIICVEKEPKVLFCGCGHLCVCKECKKFFQKYVCRICKHKSKNIRILE